MTKNNQSSIILDLEIAKIQRKHYASIATLRLNYFPGWISVSKDKNCFQMFPVSKFFGYVSKFDLTQK